MGVTGHAQEFTDLDRNSDGYLALQRTRGHACLASSHCLYGSYALELEDSWEVRLQEYTMNQSKVITQ